MRGRLSLFFLLISCLACCCEAGEQELNTLIQSQQPLPRYVEAWYSPLGRSSVVDAVLADPFYLPTYARSVANILKKKSSHNSLYELYNACLLAGGFPLAAAPNVPATPSLCPPDRVPDKFVKNFTLPTGQILYSYWLAFLQARSDAAAAFSLLTDEEKKWLRENYNAFFFGKQGSKEYNFFSTDSTMPLKFFSLASKVDFLRLATATQTLNCIVDDLYRRKQADELVFSPIEQDFSWHEQGLTFAISNKKYAFHIEEVDFFIDIAGDNIVLNNAGGTKGTRAAALHIDLSGNNVYVGRDFVQGSGLLGVGILACFSGNNRYIANTYSQGCGFFGMGLLINLGGGNHYAMEFAGQSCALFGSTLLWNRGGRSTFIAYDGMAQAASSTLGIAFLISNQGYNSYVSGVQGRGGTRSGGIGQGASTGVRIEPWINNPSFYGGVSFLYNIGGYSTFKTAWLGQGSAYFLSAGILVAEGSYDTFIADYDAQGQGLHMAAGILLKEGRHDTYKGGWGSLGAGADRSVGIFIDTGGKDSYQATQESLGTARKPLGLGLFIDTEGGNTYEYQKNSKGSIQRPQSPNDWPTALFLSVGKNNRYPEQGDATKSRKDMRWDDSDGLGIDNGVKDKEFQRSLFAKFPAAARAPFPFDPIEGWPSNKAFLPLERITSKEQLEKLIAEVATANYDRRRQLYESFDLLRFSLPSQPPFEIDLSELLANPAEASEDQFNYAALWAIMNQKKSHLDDIIEALNKNAIRSEYSREMALLFVGVFGKDNILPILARYMLCDPSKTNRYRAAALFAQRTTHEWLLIVQLALHSSEEQLRYALAKGLERRKLPGVLEIIAPLFNDPSFYVRRAAALTAISLQDKRGIPVLLDTLQFDTIDTQENYGDNIYRSLAEYVGVNFGVDKEAWIRWWERVRDSFEFPE